MRNNQINIIRGGRIGLLPILALAATLFVGNLHAQGDAQAKELLASSLPAGVTLSKASDAQMEEAVKAAVSRDPRMAEGIVRVAIITKVPASERKAAPRRSHRAPRGDGKSMSSSVDSYNPWATAGVSAAHPYVFIAATTSDAASFIAAVVSAAVSAAPDRAAEIAAAAASVAPAYAVTITQVAIQTAPGQASAITQAVSAAVPSQTAEIVGAAPAGTNVSSGSDSGVGGSAVGAPSFPSGGGGGGGTGVTDLTPVATSVTNQ